MRANLSFKVIETNFTKISISTSIRIRTRKFRAFVKFKNIEEKTIAKPTDGHFESYISFVNKKQM